MDQISAKGGCLVSSMHDKMSISQVLFQSGYSEVLILEKSEVLRVTTGRDISGKKRDKQKEIKHTHRSCSPQSLLSSILALLGQAVLCPPARTSPLKPRLENMSHRPNAHVSVMPRESDDLLVRSPEVCSPPSPHLMSKVHCSVQCIYYLLVST